MKTTPKTKAKGFFCAYLPTEYPKYFFFLLCCCIIWFSGCSFVVVSVFCYFHSSLSCLFPRAVSSVQNNACNFYLDLLKLILFCVLVFILLCPQRLRYSIVLQSGCNLTLRNASPRSHFYRCVNPKKYSSSFHCRSVKKPVLLVS